MRPPIIPDASTPRRSAVVSNNNHPEADQFALDPDAEIPPPVDASTPVTDEEVARIARAAETWRQANGLTHEAFISRFRPYVHNSKGWWLLRNKPLSQWEAGWNRLRDTVRGLSRAIHDADQASRNPLVETPVTREFGAALSMLRRQRTAQRFVFVLGKTGSGKTSTLDFAEYRLSEGRRVIRIAGRQAWQSPREFLADWGQALGCGTMPKSVANAQTTVRAALLSLGDAIILIDEGHRLTSGEINMLIDWSNDLARADDNAVHFVIAAVDTLWRKLSDHAREEADQLRVNRCVGTIQLGSPDIEEVNVLLSVGCRVASQLSDDDYTALLETLATAARNAGGRAFVRDVRALYARQPKLTLKQARQIASDVEAKNRLPRA